MDYDSNTNNKYPQSNPFHSSKPTEIDYLPNQRNQSFFSTFNNNYPSGGQTWLHNDISTQNNQSTPLPTKAIYHQAASAANLQELYDERPRPCADKIPFLGFYFDRRSLRNEFERFILLKLAGASEFHAKAALSSPSASTLPSSEMLNPALASHAQATSRASTGNSPGTTVEMSGKNEMKMKESDGTKTKFSPSSGKSESSGKKLGDKLQKKFFDEFSDVDINTQKDKSQDNTSLNRDTFGTQSDRNTNLQRTNNDRRLTPSKYKHDQSDSRDTRNYRPRNEWRSNNNYRGRRGRGNNYRRGNYSHYDDDHSNRNYSRRNDDEKSRNYSRRNEDEKSRNYSRRNEDDSLNNVEQLEISSSDEKPVVEETGWGDNNKEEDIGFGESDGQNKKVKSKVKDNDDIVFE